MDSKIIPPSIKVLQLLPDESFLYVLGQSSNRFYVISFDTKSFEPYTKFLMQISYQERRQSGVDESCLYLPTVYGQILMVDKFSGEILGPLDTGWGVVASSVWVQEQEISCLCGYPISNGLDINATQYSICVLDKDTGKRTARSKFVHRTPFKYATDGNCRYLVSGTTIDRYSPDCRWLESSTIPFACDNEMVLTDDYIVCSNSGGLVIFLNKSDFSVKNAIFMGGSISQPILYEDNHILVVLGKEVVKIGPYGKENLLSMDDEDHSGDEYVMSAYTEGFLFLLSKGGVLWKVAI